MKKAKERQITFYADPDVYEWLKKQESVTRCINSTLRTCMAASEGGVLDPTSVTSRLSGIASSSAITTVVGELEAIQESILRSYKRQQSMISALRTHQKLFEKSATLYREIGRIKDEEVEQEPHDAVVSSYHELLMNSAESIREIIESSEEEQATVIAQGGVKERLIAAIQSDDTNTRDVDAPARSFSMKKQNSRD